MTHILSEVLEDSGVVSGGSYMKGFCDGQNCDVKSARDIKNTMKD